MKSYAIYDKREEQYGIIGYLFYYKKSESFIIELCEELDEWSAPLLFQKFVHDHVYTIPRQISLLWVKERVIPSGRQNIGMILKNHKMTEYNEMSFLKLSGGRCSQDDCYLREIAENELPESIRTRMQKNVKDCFPSKDQQLICLFKDGIVKKVDLSRLTDEYHEIAYVLKNTHLLDSVRIGVGGYSILFQDCIEIPAAKLREIGQTLPLFAEDFDRFVSRNVVDASKTCELLQCSRQNLSYLVKEEKLTPIIYGAKENLYLRGEIENLMND